MLRIGRVECSAIGFAQTMGCSDKVSQAMPVLEQAMPVQSAVELNLNLVRCACVLFKHFSIQMLVASMRSFGYSLLPDFAGECKG